MSDNTVSKALGVEEATAPPAVEDAVGQTLGELLMDEETGRPLTEEDLIDQLDWAEVDKSDHSNEEAAKLGNKEKSTEKDGQQTAGANETPSDEQTPTEADETKSDDETPSAGGDDCDQIPSIADIRLEDADKDEE